MHDCDTFYSTTWELAGCGVYVVISTRTPSQSGNRASRINPGPVGASSALLGQFNPSDVSATWCSWRAKNLSGVFHMCALRNTPYQVG